MANQANDLRTKVTQSEWFKSLSKYEKPSTKKAIGQLLNTLVPYAALWAIMVYMIQVRIPYGYLLPLMVVAAGLAVRSFIIFHDCGHNSFFASRRTNRIVGTLCGLLTFTPYDEWRLSHAEHHAGAGDLSRRGVGDIWTMTVAEFQAAPRAKRIWYRIYRNPLILFGFGPVIKFVILQRFPNKEDSVQKRRSVVITNVLLLLVIGLACATIGLRTYLLIQVPVMWLAGAMGIWLFYVQHQYEDVYWDQHQEWDPIKAALEGSSYYKLPKILQWFSGNIGLHHIHHLRPRIPNYNLQRCQNEIPAFQEVEPLTLRTSLKSVFLRLWDETDRKMITFRAMKSLARRNMASN